MCLDSGERSRVLGPSCFLFRYSKTCVKWPLSKRPKFGFQDKLSLNAGQKYWSILQDFRPIIKLPFVIKIFLFSIILSGHLLYIYLVRMSTIEFEENKNTYIPFKDKMSQYPCADPEKSSQRFLLLSFTYLSQGCTPGGYSDIFIHIRRLGNVSCSKFWILILLGVFRKMNIILSWKILWIFFGVISKLDYIWGSVLCSLWSFLKAMDKKWNIFLLLN